MKQSPADTSPHRPIIQNKAKNQNLQRINLYGVLLLNSFSFYAETILNRNKR